MEFSNWELDVKLIGLTHRCEITLIFLSSFALAGCSQPSTHGTVDGTVTLDDEPLDEGTVRFVPVNGASQTAAAMVRGGKFTATVPVGLMRVEFSAARVVGKQRMIDDPKSPEVDVVHELLPSRYNVESELTFEVVAGSQDVPFELTSK